MTSRERIIAAINHETPDICPIDLGGCGQTGMNASTMYNLRKAMGLAEKPISIVEPMQMLGEVDEDLRRAVMGDVVGLFNRGTMLGYQNINHKPFTMDDGTPTLMGGGFIYDKNEHGDTIVPCNCEEGAPYAYCMPKGGSFFDSIDHSEPISLDDEDKLNAREDFKDDFKVCTDEDARYWEEESKKIYEGTDYAIMGVLGGAGLGDVALIPGPNVKHPKGIRKMDDWLIAHAMYPEYIYEVFELQTEVMLKNLEIYKQAVGERIQTIWISGTDFGTQNSLFASLDSFREIYKPHYKKINDWVHNNTGWKTFYHTCGCITKLLPDLADMGVDCLNPVQFSAMENAGTTPESIKAEFGDKFTFWGGGVDTQHTLPFGTPEEVAAQVKERVRILNEGGGFVFSTIHNVVSGVPAENLIAMYEAVRK